MQGHWFAAAIVLALSASEPALACRTYSKIVLDDVRYADVVVVGRISGYRIVRDEAFRQEMLSNPNLSPEGRRMYEGRDSLLPDYARFEIQVDEVLFGSAPNRLSVTWDNSTFGEPEEMGVGPFLIALRRPSSTTPPLRGPSATILPNAEPDLYTVLQAPCSSPFLFENMSNEASIVRRIVRARQP
jgi:hypothetical protein